MGVDPYARSTEASTIVQAWLPISAAIVTHFVTHFGATSAPHPSLAGIAGVSDHDTRGGRLARQGKANLARIAGPHDARSESTAWRHERRRVLRVAQVHFGVADTHANLALGRARDPASLADLLPSVDALTLIPDRDHQSRPVLACRSVTILARGAASRRQPCQRQCHVGSMSRTAGGATRARRSSRGCCCSGTRSARPE